VPLIKDTPHLPGTFNRSSPAGLVRVRAPVAASRFLASRSPPLLADRPGLQIEPVVGDRFSDMIDNGLDLAAHTREITNASLVIRRVGLAARVIVAVPSYIERHGAPTLPAHLADHICFVHDTGPDSDLWPLIAPEGTESIRVSGRFIANGVAAVHLAVRGGRGLAFLALALVFDDLRAAHLIRILSNYPPPPDSSTMEIST
jgi:DNA-binding transcriptional LysR family regulator